MSDSKPSSASLEDPALTQRTLVVPGGAVAPDVPARVPTLTILWHPDTSRVGDVYVANDWEGSPSLDLSRVHPAFRGPRGGAPNPIREPYTSRKPLSLRWLSDGSADLSADPGASVAVVDGITLDGPLRLPKEAIDRGVILEIGPHVALCLHRSRGLAARAQTHHLMGESDAVQTLRQHIDRIATVPTKVLVRGATGTGKELVARAIHEASERSGFPFVAVNMANLQEGTAAAQLFGHAKGAFSGADRRHDGYFGAADGGTLFLDEVGELPSQVQTMLLRALDSESGSVEIQPVGDSRTRTVDVRVLSATDAPLEDAVSCGRFDDALANRLSEYVITVPPLTERLEDIGRLFLHFAKQALRHIEEEHRLGPPEPGAQAWMSAAQMGRLARYGWPGNVRELRNTARQIVFGSRGSEQAAFDETIETRLGTSPGSLPVADPAREVQPDGRERPLTEARLRRPSTLDEDELIEALRAHDWSPGPTAKALGMSKTTLYALIEKSARIRKAQDLTADDITWALEEADGDTTEAAKVLEVSARGLKLRMKHLDL